MQKIYLTRFFNFLKIHKLKSGILAVVVFAFLFFIIKFISSSSTPTFQTSTVTRGTLVISVSGSGTVSATNNANVTTQATGVVSKIYVHDGDEVKTGDEIAEIDLDLSGKEKAQSAWSSYQSAKNTLEAARASAYSLQSGMFTSWKTYMNIAQNGTYQNTDGTPNNVNRALPEFHIAQDDWLAGEAKYKNQEAVIAQAQTAVSSAWYSYQQSSSVIYAPISGTISGMSLQEGTVIASSTTKIANIKTMATPLISINLNEIDVPKVKVGNRGTVTLDAFPDKTYTGKVISIDLAGVVTSGVTTYPTIIKLDAAGQNLLSNMAVSATIITATKADILLVPLAAVQTNNGESTVRVLKKGKPVSTPVEIGLSSDTEVEIVSGLTEEDEVITGNIATQTVQNRQSTSPFGATFGGGGALRGISGGTGRGR